MTPPLVMLVAISTLQPVAVNILAPATPGLARALATDYSTIQLTLTVYLATVAIAQIFVGPISDRFGRRPCILAGAALFLLGSALGAFAASIETLLFSRVVQAIGSGACFALARAVVRDTSSMDRAASVMGYMVMAMVVAPMISPFLGGLIEETLGWRAIFLAKAALGALVLAAVWVFLHETAPRSEPASMLSSLQGFPTLLGDPAFVLYTLSLSFVSAAFFMFIAGAPWVVIETMGRAPQVYGLYFMINAVGYMLGNFIAGRFGQRLGAERLMIWGATIASVAMLAALFFAYLGPWNPLTFFIPIALSSVGSGMTLPGATAAALSVRPKLAGTASGLSGAAQLGMGAAAAAFGGYVVQIDSRALILAMLAAAVLGLVCARTASARTARGR
ncbi:MAG: Bcr/CflA family efflux MFS transporter [Salinarimonadaceae bacterium]|nr:MAG: Bcr/CflA family efflux MFS transporter [Salinarimonadaceae bacterium]